MLDFLCPLSSKIAAIKWASVAPETANFNLVGAPFFVADRS